MKIYIMFILLIAAALAAPVDDSQTTIVKYENDNIGNINDTEERRPRHLAGSAQRSRITHWPLWRTKMVFNQAFAKHLPSICPLRQSHSINYNLRIYTFIYKHVICSIVLYEI